MRSRGSFERDARPFRLSGTEEQCVRVPGKGLWVCLPAIARCVCPAGSEAALVGSWARRPGLHRGFCFAQRGAVTWLGLGLFLGEGRVSWSPGALGVGAAQRAPGLPGLGGGFSAS